MSAAVTVLPVTSASSLILATIPSPDRGVWQLDLGFITLPLRAYALCIIVGIIVAIWWGEKRLIARGGTAGTVIDVAVYAVPFGLVGGRLYHVATDYYRYFGEGKNPLDALRIWDGGLGIWGAIALGGVGAWIGCKRKGVPLPVFADAVAPGIVTAQAIGRIGNYFNQELYGGPTDLPWGLELYQRLNEFGVEDPLNGVAVDHVLVDGSPVHPTFLYELVWNLLVALLVVWADRKFRLGHGRAFAVYVAGYTVGRGVIEMMRTDPATEILGLRINVFTSVLLFIGAVAYIVLTRKRGEREDLSTVDGTVISTDEAAASSGDGEVPQPDTDPEADTDSVATDSTPTDSAAPDSAAPDSAATDSAATDSADPEPAAEPRRRRPTPPPAPDIDDEPTDLDAEPATAKDANHTT
jgi:prolipoprotein diacylglyceryl transferase